MRLAMDKLRLRKNVTKWRKTKRGLVTNLYHKMKERGCVEFKLEFLHEFAECKKFDRLFEEWVKNNYNKQFKPSIDRISNKGIYAKKNIQWLTWAENRYKQTMERRSRNGAVLMMLGNKVVERFKSQREAVMKTGLSQSNMSSCLNGKRETCGGYKWKYHENPELIEVPNED